MDEVFGSSNLFAEMVVIRAEGGGLAKRVVKGHDYLIGYTRNSEQFPGMYRAKDVRGEVVVVDGRKYWIETDWLRAEFGKYGTLAYEDIEAVKGIDKKREIDEGILAGTYRLIPKGDGHIVGRLRPLDSDGSKFYSVLKHLNSSAKDSLIPLGLEGVFSNPKPVSLIKEIIMGATRFSKSSEQIILDFFAGSGTTAQAVLEANAEDSGNRRYMCVQWPEDLTERVTQVTGPAKKTVETALSFCATEGLRPNLAEITKERLRRAGAEGTDIHEDNAGFRVFRVDSTNLSDVFHSPNELTQSELYLHHRSIKPDRSGEDLLFHVLLDWGLELSLPIVRDTVDDREVFSVDDGALIACFAQSVSPEVVRTIAERGPLRAVFRDDAFETDASRINAEQIFREVSPSTEIRTV